MHFYIPSFIVEGEGDHAGVVLARDGPATELTPKEASMILEFIDPTTLERFRAEAISDNRYIGRRSWSTEDI